jgi:3-isopropylmalate/(R)-2-methylmalate dehydratase small subunit
VVDQLFTDLRGQPEYRLGVDLGGQLVINASGVEFPFEIDEFRKYCLLNGLDDIGLTMQKSAQIKSFEQQYYQKLPWLR